MTWTVPQITRNDSPFVGSERDILSGYLDWQRTTLLLKCAGLNAAQLVEASTPPSRMTLLGLVRHLTDVERMWFRRYIAGQQAEQVYRHLDDRPGASFDLVDPRNAEADVDRLVAEWQLCRDAIADLDLDTEFKHPEHGPMSLRWILVHMIEEYARHNGHADLLRERIDGATGT